MGIGGGGSYSLCPPWIWIGLQLKGVKKNKIYLQAEIIEKSLPRVFETTISHLSNAGGY